MSSLTCYQFKESDEISSRGSQSIQEKGLKT